MEHLKKHQPDERSVIWELWEWSREKPELQGEEEGDGSPGISGLPP